MLEQCLGHSGKERDTTISRPTPGGELDLLADDLQLTLMEQYFACSWGGVGHAIKI